MKKQLAKLALTAAIGLALTFTQAAATPLTDSRDKKTYKTVKIGEQVWMAENLNYEAKGSKCGGTNIQTAEGEEGTFTYSTLEDKNTANCDKYGRLYDGETVAKACPSGWHLPSDKEWQTLVDFAGGNDKAGVKLKAAKFGGTDNFGFSALSGGDGDNTGNFLNVGEEGYWWSSTETPGHSAYCWKMLSNFEFVERIDMVKLYFLSVRCIKD